MRESRSYGSVRGRPAMGVPTANSFVLNILDYCRLAPACGRGRDELGARRGLASSFPQVRGLEVRRRQAVRAVWAGVRGVGRRGEAGQVSEAEIFRNQIGVLAQPIAGTLDMDDDGVVKPPVEERGGNDGMAEELTHSAKPRFEVRLGSWRRVRSGR
jgi:hypothetical protein